MYKIISAMVLMTLITTTVSFGNVYAHNHHYVAPTPTPVSHNGGFLNTGLPLIDLSGKDGDSIFNRALCTNFNLC